MIRIATSFLENIKTNLSLYFILRDYMINLTNKERKLNDFKYFWH